MDPTIIFNRILITMAGLYLLFGVCFVAPLVADRDLIDVPALLYLPLVLFLAISWPFWLMVLFSAALIKIVMS